MRREWFYGMTLAMLVAAAGCVSGSGKPSEFGVLHAPRAVHPVAADAPGTVLVQDGKPVATIVLADTDDKVLRRKLDFAAKELQSLLKQASGAELAIVRSSVCGDGPAIFLGDSEAARNAGFDFGELAPDSFRVKTAGGNLAVIGNDDGFVMLEGAAGDPIKEDHGMDSRGTLFGVYDLLERHLGVRFYFAGELGTIVPKQATVTIPALDYEDAPVYKRRTMYPPQCPVDGTKKSTNFRYRWRYGNTGINACNHSYNGWSTLYAETKPYIFALKKDGTRDTTYFGGHLNYVHPEILKLEIEHLERYYETGWREPWGKWVVFPHNSHVPVMVNDCFGDGCQSDEFQAYVNRYRERFGESKLGEHSEVIHTYFNNLAREIKKRWPNRYLLMGAYSRYSLPHPDVDYADNVIVELCVMDGMAFQKEPEKYRFWLDNLKEYKRRTGNKPYCWLYPCWPLSGTKAPIHMPNLLVRWHRDARETVAGIFLCGAPRTFAQDHLSFYIRFRAMWNPDFDVQAALDEYYRLCYGPAAPVMKRYYELMIDRWENVPWNVPCGREGGLPLDKLYGLTYNRDVRAKLKALEQEALAAAPADSDFGRRVKMVVDAQKPFYVEAELYDRLDRGTVLYVPRGTPDALDGKLDDACWQVAGDRMLFRDSGKPIPLRSRTILCYDDEGLYVGCDFEEPHMDKLRAKAGKHDESAWNDDGIEFFLCPKKTLDHYVQIAVNTDGVIFDGWKESIASFTAAKNFKVERAVRKKGDGYGMEVKIPWSELGMTAPQPGTSRRGNVIRNRRAGGQSGIYALSPTLGQSNHNTKFFGTLVFTDRDRFREDFEPTDPEDWQASVRHGKGMTPDPDAFARLSRQAGSARLDARLSKSYHVAGISHGASASVSRGDQLEVRYRGPYTDGYGRLEVSFVLKDAQGNRKHGWLADNRKLPRENWRIFTADLFKLAKVDGDNAELVSVNLLLAGGKGKETAMEFDYVRVSPHTAATVE